jgi:hypothetical protein
VINNVFILPSKTKHANPFNSYYSPLSLGRGRRLRRQAEKSRAAKFLKLISHFQFSIFNFPFIKPFHLSTTRLLALGNWAFNRL